MVMWSNKDPTGNLEKMQKKAFRIVLSHDCFRTHSYSDVCQVLNILPVAADRLEILNINLGNTLIKSDKHGFVIRSNVSQLIVCL